MYMLNVCSSHVDPTSNSACQTIRLRKWPEKKWKHVSGRTANTFADKGSRRYGKSIFKGFKYISHRPILQTIQTQNWDTGSNGDPSQHNPLGGRISKKQNF